MSSPHEVATAGRIVGTSEMAGRVREFDWAGTALGPISRWSETLIASMNFVLASPVSTIVMVGPQLVTFYNDAYIPTLMDRHPRALGMRGNVLWEDAWAAVGGQIEAVLETGISYRFNNVLIPVDRAGVSVDTYFTYSFSPIHEAANGSIAGVMCMAQDVTEAHQASLELAATQHRVTLLADELHRVMGATTDAIVSINRNWEISYLNAVATQTYAAGRSLLGKNLWKEFPEASYPGSPYVTHYERAMFENTSGSFEAFYPEPLNIWIRLSVFPTAEGIVTFSRDISEERRTASVLLQTEKLAAVGRLASSIAHEINNPLEAVTNLLYLAQREPDVQEIRRLLHIADDELRRVSAIANQTLRFHRQASRPRHVSCAELLSSVLTMHRSRLANADITVDNRCSPTHLITVYEGEIRQVFNNLLSNAIDAMPLGGRLQIRCHEAVGHASGLNGLVLTFADSGAGIPREKLEKVFDAFYTTKGIGGTGLGLWISNEIVKRHGGHIRVRSSQQDGRSGTVFQVLLPHQSPASLIERNVEQPRP